MSLGPVEAFLEMRSVDLLLVDKESETMSFALILLNLGFELLRFLRELSSERLEFLELSSDMCQQ